MGENSGLNGHVYTPGDDERANALADKGWARRSIVVRSVGPQKGHGSVVRAKLLKCAAPGGGANLLKFQAFLILRTPG